MERPAVRDPSMIVAILCGIEDAKVLKFVEDEDSEEGAFGIMIETPLAETRCPTCEGEVLETGRVVVELPPTTVGPAHVLIAWKRRQWRCADKECPQGFFDEENDDVDRFIARVAPGRRSKKLRRLSAH
jgi:hypothetical protein